MASELTHARLLQLLHYDPQTGVFTRRVTGGRNRWLAGTIAGALDRDSGYVQIGLGTRKFWAHRLAWFYMKGEWPTDKLDHKDTIRDHNWIDNLRPATQSENMQNQRRAQRGSKCGLLGVSVDQRTGNFRPTIKVNGKQKYLGLYPTREEAHAAYLAAKAQLHPFQTITEQLP